MDVQILSVERMKPSSPTPKHLRNYKLCLLDQLFPVAYAPIVIFYRDDHHRVLEKLSELKKSLSKILSHFFPLAGTVADDLSIDCDDQGAFFTTTKVNYRLNEYLENPNLKLIAKFLPYELATTGLLLPVTNIQASVFECGGIAIGVCISHKILDGTALSTFLKSWANAANSSQENPIINPDFSAASLFPADDVWLKDASTTMWGSLFKKGRFITKRFIFYGPAIASLKKMANGSSRARPITRVEVVSGFIWKYAKAAFEERVRSDKEKPSLLTHVVNLRRRANPNFSEHSLGNLVWIASAKYTTKSADEEEENRGLPFFVDEVRKSLSKIDGDYVEKLRGGDEGKSTMRGHFKEIDEFVRCDDHVHGFSISSWCNLGLYDVDFGWGKPVWVTSIDASGPFFMNLAILVDLR